MSGSATDKTYRDDRATIIHEGGGRLESEMAGFALGIENSENVNPELLIIGQSDGNKVKEVYEQVDSGEKRGSVRRLILEEADSESDTYKNRKELKMVWKDPNAVVVYKYGSDSSGQDDKLVFQSDSLMSDGNRRGMISVSARDFNKVLENQGVRRLVFTPQSEEDAKSFLSVLQGLDIDKSRYKGTKLFVEKNSPVQDLGQVEMERKLQEQKRTVQNAEKYRRSGSGPDTFDLKVGLRKSKADIEELGLKEGKGDPAQDFFGAWTKYGENEIKSLGFIVEAGAISKVVLNLNPTPGIGGEYDSLEMSLGQLLKSLKEARPYESVTGQTIGLTLKKKDGHEITISPFTSLENVQRTVSNLRVNGVGLPKGTEVYIKKVEPTKIKEASEKPLPKTLSLKYKGEDNLERRTHEYKELVGKFINLWADNDVGEIKILTAKEEGELVLSGIEFFSKDGKQSGMIPAYLSTYLFKGVQPHKIRAGKPADVNNVSARTVGLRFYFDGSANYRFVAPYSDPKKLKEEVFDRLEIDGRKITGDYTVKVE